MTPQCSCLSSSAQAVSFAREGRARALAHAATGAAAAPAAHAWARAGCALAPETASLPRRPPQLGSP